jgi:hypothetical protein
VTGDVFAFRFALFAHLAVVDDLCHVHDVIVHFAPYCQTFTVNVRMLRICEFGTEWK